MEIYIQTIISDMAKSVESRTHKNENVQVLVTNHNRYYTVIFRGTERKGKDILHDISIWPSSESDYMPRGCSGFKDHAMLGCDALMEDQFIDTDKPIIMGGHSLGGIASYFAACYLEMQNWNVVGWVGCGVPNGLWLSENEAGFICKSYVYEEDIITKIPPGWLGFRPPVEPTQLGEWNGTGDINDHDLEFYIGYIPRNAKLTIED